MTVADLNAGNRDAFVVALGHLFEHSPWVAEAAFEKRPFRDAEHLHRELCAAMNAASAERQLALINAHPDLGGRLAREGKLTTESAREQAAAGLDQMTDAEAAELTRWNQRYREIFGFPFILCARLADRQTILAEIKRRSTHTPDEEHAVALGEIEKIAWLRLQDTLAQEAPAQATQVG